MRLTAVTAAAPVAHAYIDGRIDGIAGRIGIAVCGSRSIRVRGRDDAPCHACAQRERDEHF
jgi:hypothetical protein